MAKYDLTFDPPVMNAAGTLGFAPDVYNQLDWSQLGAFITNPISLGARTPAHGMRYAAYPGGFLLHTGHPNRGLESVIRHYAGHWKRSPLPVIIHLLARSPEELFSMVRKLENVDGVSGLEIGLAGEAGGGMLEPFIQAAAGELPVIMQLPMERSADLAAVAIQAGAAVISLAAPRGILPTPEGKLVQGRLYGPAIFPQALKAVQELVRLGLPTIGSGGIYTQGQKQAMLAAGATAVQLDASLWRAAGTRILT